jgi:hypothetical protein
MEVAFLTIHLPYFLPFHKKYEKYFYFIPGSELARHGCFVVEGTVTGKRRIYLYPLNSYSEGKNKKRAEWCNQHLYSYDDPYVQFKLWNVFMKELYIRGRVSCNPPQINLPRRWNMPGCINISDLMHKNNLCRIYPTDKSVFYTFELLGLRILERGSPREERRKTDRTGLVRLNCNYSKGSKKHKYEEGQFDLMWNHMPSIYEKYFTLIPNSVLLEYGKLKTTKYLSKLNVTGSVGKEEIIINILHNDGLAMNNPWVHEFIFRYDDDNFVERLLELKNKYCMPKDPK